MNPDYARLIRRADQSEDNTFLKNHLQEARWFIKSLASRNDTIVRVAAKIVELQQDFLEYGDEAMKPMVLRDVAEDINMHESTISRVTTNKYAYTPQGIFELKYFFNSSIKRVHGEAIASASVQEKIKRLVESEDPRKPYSDSKMADMLKADNIDIARRTVAKYREMMGILSSSKRKQF